MSQPSTSVPWRYRFQQLLQNWKILLFFAISTVVLVFLNPRDNADALAIADCRRYYSEAKTAADTGRVDQIHVGSDRRQPGGVTCGTHRRTGHID